MLRYVLFVLCLLIFGCGETPKIESESKQEIYDKQDYKIVMIDDCEYINITYKRSMLTHKGDCKNPKHIYWRQ